MSRPVWFITGCTSGFGEAIAKEALHRGHKVIATARRSERLSALKDCGAAVLDFDVAAGDDVISEALAAANRIYGRITHVINCAGYILSGAVEEYSTDEVAALFTTNVIGAASVSRAAIPFLREAAATAQGQPVVLANFGSLGTYLSYPGVSMYCATKAAVSLFSDGMAAELAPFGVTACAIEPGYFRTGFLNTNTDTVHRVQASKSIALYDNTPAHEGAKALDMADNQQLGDVTKGARVIVDVLTKSGVAEGKEIPPRLILGSDIVKVIRQKILEAENMLEDWEAIASTTDHE